MSKFVTALQEEDNFTLTENLATALKSTTSFLVDLFGQIGAFRTRSESDIEAAFSKAFAEDKLLATKMAFYARNIRGGLGERRVFRIIMRFLAKVYPEVAANNIDFIPEFGRYDDLYAFVGTEVEGIMWDFICDQWIADVYYMEKGEPISLLAKWLKSTNTSSKESVRLGKLTAKHLGLFEKEYRKTLAALRKHIDVVEKKMTAQQWDNIDYSGVPSRAMTIYRKAFARHDEDGFTEYINKVSSGEEKIHASTLYPYDIMEQMKLNWDWYDRSNHFKFGEYDEVLELQWKALPNYIEGENNVLIMADTSASMQGRPIHTSIGLAIYFAERNKGAFKDKFMTFSERPSFVELKGETLYEKAKCIPAIVENTNLEAAFRLILETAIKHNLTVEDMPKSLVVISDMQFDYQTMDSEMTWHDAMVKMFAENGYAMPNIIYWNVDSRRDTFQVTSEYQGVQLASGQSPSVFKSILNNIGKTPYEAMLAVLNDPVYDCITV